jgi:hypothetical protein
VKNGNDDASTEVCLSTIQVVKIVAYFILPRLVPFYVFFWSCLFCVPSPKTQKPRLPVVGPVAPTTVSHTVPAPPAVSTSSSVSPSPFAPPPASAPIAVPVSQSLSLPSSSSSLQLTVKAKSPDVVPVRPEALSSNLDAESEYVMQHTSASTSQSDAGEAGARGNSTVDHLDALKYDPPDQPQPRAPSRQVCLSSRTVLLSACVYAYVSCDRVRCCRLWIPPIAPHDRPHDTRRRPLCSSLPRLRASHPPTFFPQKNPTHQMSYPWIRHHRHHHRHRRPVEFIAVTNRSSQSPISKDGN